MKTNAKRKPAILALAIGMAVIMILAATFAWFTAQDSVTNKLATKDALANVKIIETFVEPDDWKPGQEITKEVAVVNTGTAPALARVHFTELLNVNVPARETVPFNAAQEGDKKIPQTIDTTPFTGWVEVTATANPAIGGLKLASAYSTLKVFTKYVTAPTSVPDSYSFAIWSTVSGTTYAGQAQAVDYAMDLDKTTKTLTLTDIEYLIYQGYSQAADWKAGKPAVADIVKSLAETTLNGTTGPTLGNYPNNLVLNYYDGNMSTTLADNKWYYNEDDGYFYYVGVIAGGEVSPALLRSLLLGTAADSDYYSNMKFELTVNMDAIQNTKAALAANDGWKLPAGDLRTALEAFCES